MAVGAKLKRHAATILVDARTQTLLAFSPGKPILTGQMRADVSGLPLVGTTHSSLPAKDDMPKVIAQHTTEGETDYASVLLAEAAEQRAAGCTDEWLESTHIRGLRFKEREVSKNDLPSAEWQIRRIDKSELDKLLAEEVIGGLHLEGTRLDLSNTNVKTLFGCKFSGSWERLALGTKTLVRCDFKDAVVGDLTLTCALLADVTMDRLAAEHTNVAGARFRRCSLKQVYFSELVGGGKAPTLEASFEDTDLQGARFVKGTLPIASFHRCDLRRTDFGEVALDRVAVPYSNLGGASFERAGLTRRTEFVDVASVSDCRISRAGLDSLDNFGGLTPRQRQEMRVSDPLAELRNQFSGFVGAFHTAALCAFVGPYALFLARQYWTSELTKCSGACETILSAFWRFIYTGGTMDGGPTWSLALFTILVAYNVARGLLLWRTKTLELALSVTGITPQFSLDGVWGKVLTVAKLGTLVNIIAISVHIAHFLQRLVSL